MRNSLKSLYLKYNANNVKYIEKEYLHINNKKFLITAQLTNMDINTIDATIPHKAITFS